MKCKHENLIEEVEGLQVCPDCGMEVTVTREICGSTDINYSPLVIWTYAEKVEENKNEA